MDAQNPSANPTFASRTPIHVGAVALTVRDLERMTTFYRDLLGLTVLERSDTHARLGVGAVTIVVLEHRPQAKADDAREAGLYHTAFLMPTRADLARWLIHVAGARLPLTGASDHEVSEAIYLDDPEGNGIEVYSDRPTELWHRQDGQVRMTTDPLDLNDLAAAAAGQAWSGAPAGLRVGHVHLRVGDVGKAETFFRGVVGLDLTRRRNDGAAFMSSGGYHHHVAGNVWHSKGAGPRDPDRAGLAWFALELADGSTAAALRGRLRQAGIAVEDDGAGFTVADPWGTRIHFALA
jgi:catechol 2,3-dioxygenase